VLCLLADSAGVVEMVLSTAEQLSAGMAIGVVPLVVVQV
jgi:hypothetical protein